MAPEQLSAGDGEGSGGENTRRRIDLATRLEELCASGHRRAASQLAKSVLQNTGDVHVEIGSSTIAVETAHFSGTHGWRVTADDEIVIDERGEYWCTLDGVDLSFSTVTMNETAYRIARSKFTPQNERHASHSYGSDNDASLATPTTDADPASAESKGEWSVIRWIRTRFR